MIDQIALWTGYATLAGMALLLWGWVWGELRVLATAIDLFAFRLVWGLPADHRWTWPHAGHDAWQLVIVLWRCWRQVHQYKGYAVEWGISYDRPWGNSTWRGYRRWHTPPAGAPRAWRRTQRSR